MNIKYNFLVGLCSLGLLMSQTSCEDFLDKSPDMGLTEDDAYKSYESMRNYMDKAYTFLDDYLFRDVLKNGRSHIGAISDELIAMDNQASAINTINSGNWLSKKIGGFEIGSSADGNKMTSIYRSYYAIRIVNRVIQDIDKVNVITDEQKKELLGQAHFLRAWYYFQLIKRYGGMPKLDKMFVGDGDDDVPRMTYHESHDWMMEDLKNAIELLPDVWDDDNVGRVNKIGAMALKSMAQLYDASPLMQNNLEKTEIMPYDKERAKQSAQSAQAVLDYMEQHPECGNYLMATETHPDESYKHIFYWTAPPYFLPEFIWYNRAIKNDIQYSQKSMWQTQQFAKNVGADGVACCMPTQNIVDMFEKKGSDGKYYPINHPKAEYDVQNPFDARDPRFYNNILYFGQEWGTDESDKKLYVTSYEGGYIADYFKSSNYTNKKTQTGYFCKKYIWETANGYKNEYNTMKIATVYIRVAQIYLDLAEASFEATGSATAKVEGCSLSALDALNIVRRRAGITDLTSDIYDNPDEFREAYRRERAVELMFENHRWYDLRRWMIAHEVFSGNNPIKGMKATPTNKNHNAVEDKSTLEFTFEVIPLTTERRIFQMRNYWYPFSMDDVGALNNLKQNPGW